MVKKRILPKNYSVHMKAHPDFYELTEEYKKKFQKKGIKMGQVRLTKAIYEDIKKLQEREGLIKYAKRKRK